MVQTLEDTGVLPAKPLWMLYNPALTASMCLTAAQWGRALLWGGTLLISDVSEDQALKWFWALQDQSQRPSDTAGAFSKAHAHCHGSCRNKAFLLVPWPRLNTNWSLPCAMGKWSQSQLEENAAGNWLQLTFPGQHFANFAPPHPESAQPLTAADWCPGCPVPNPAK